MKPSRLGAAALIVAIALAGAAVLARPRFVAQPELMLSSPKGAVLAVIALRDGRFDHVFIHSVHRSEVVERFVVEPGAGGGASLRLYELRYENQGVGMPSDAEGGYRLEGGKFILSMDRRFDRIPIFVSILPGHGILANGEYLPFRNWARPEELIVLTGRIRPTLRFGR